MGAQVSTDGRSARAARIAAFVAVLACLFALLAPLTSAQAAAVHRPTGAVAAAPTGSSGPGTVLGATLDAVASGGHAERAVVGIETAGASAHRHASQHADESTAPRGPPGRRH